MYKLVCFDLDGTLALSKTPMDQEMAILLAALVENYHVAVISGGGFPQFEKQLLSQLHRSHVQYEKLLLLPTCGSKLYTYLPHEWFVCQYADPIDEDDKKQIMATLAEIFAQSWFKPEKIYGELVEDRITQISLSALGQDAPLEEKKSWDPDWKKRMILIDKIAPLFPNYYFKMWWTTTIDVTKYGIDKSFGMGKLMEMLCIPKEDIAFIGDNLEPGGNDYPVKAMGIDSRATTWPEQTKDILRTQFLSLK